MGLFSKRRKKEPAAPSKKGSEITFTLQTGDRKYEHGQIGSTVISELLEGLSTDNWDFITLVPDTPIHKSNFLQVGAPSDPVTRIMAVEMSFTAPGRLQMFRYETADKQEILQMLIDYRERHIIPDYSRWKNVTDEMFG